MNYEIKLSQSATKSLKKLDKPTRKRMIDHLLILTDNPRHPELDIKKLKGYDNKYRLRVGNYRVIYSIEDHILRIYVFKMGSRGDIYK